MIIVIQGASAVGKSHLAKRLSEDLGIGILTKDGIKEMLYDSIGIPEDVDRSIMYGTAAMRAFFVIVDEWLKSDSKRHLILESAFFADYADKDFADIKSKYDPGLMQIYVTADADVRKQRFADRVNTGLRHEGHRDFERKDVFHDETDSRYRPIAIQHTISIDTTNFDNVDYDGLLKAIKGELNEKTN